ncbi:MAG: helix-turn-helix domain-containing protein [Pseudomonadota bacterium]
MIIRKLRLQRGWSQEQLAQMADVSVRTIQRMERGNPPSLETAKALAAVFEVHVESLTQGAHDMGTDTSTHSTTNISAERPPSTDPNATVSEEEGNAIQYVKGLKEFYSHAGMFAVFAIVVVVFKRTDDPAVLWAFAGWGVGVVLHGLVAFELINLFNARWEKRQVEKRLGRKL